jgi:hypothetical protein
MNYVWKDIWKEKVLMCLGQERRDGKTEPELLTEFIHIKNNIYKFIFSMCQKVVRSLMRSIVALVWRELGWIPASIYFFINIIPVCLILCITLFFCSKTIFLVT